MPLNLVDTTKEPIVKWVHFWIDPKTQRKIDNPDSIEGLEKVEFGIKVLSSKDIQSINDQVYESDRGGHANFKIGKATKLKILKAVKFCKNVGDVDDAEKEIRFTEAIYEHLPGWLSDWLVEQVNDINNLTPDLD